MTCQCRMCSKKYEEEKSRADFKGYCSQGCMHNMARRLGFRTGKRAPAASEYEVLHQSNAIGSVEVASDYSVLCDFIMKGK